MSEETQLDRVFHFIMKRMIETGQAPFYTDIASELGVTVEEGRKALRDLFGAGVAGWLFPNADYIVSFAPFNNLPTQYRITVDGQQKWFGQGGFESLAVSWLFKGKTVQINAPCLDCGLPIRVEMKDGLIKSTEPEGLVGYTSVPFREWFKDLPYSGSTMNLFRSGKHVRKWNGFKAGTEEGIVDLSTLAKLFSVDIMTKRLDPAYMSHFAQHRAASMPVRAEIVNNRQFWLPKAP